MNNEIGDKLKEMITKNPNSALITVDEDGSPVDRVMWTARIDDDYSVYYATSVKTGKVDRIKRNPRVLVMWTSETGYISMQGKAEIVSDPSLLADLWRDSFAPYFPGGKTDPDYVALRVSPESLTCIDDCSAPVKHVALD